MQFSSLHHPEHLLSRFCLCGISYQKTDAATRGLFHINEGEKNILFKKSKESGIRSLFILNTCNRTEIYAYVNDQIILSNIFIAVKGIDLALFVEKSYFKKGTDALQHLFSVAAGLDSQILGDYEIVGQLRQALSFSQKEGLIGPVMDRTIGYALQASKKIKTTTSLSSGTTSVSFASIEWLKKNTVVEGKHIALIGIGKFGTVIGKHLKHYFPGCLITVCNRTDEKAMEFAKENNLHFASYETLALLISNADIIIVSTHAQQPTVLKQYILTSKQRIFLDLSIPYNIHPDIKKIPGQQVLNVDDISVMLTDIISKRKNEIPKALKIINELQQEFLSWLNSYRHAPMVREMKDKLLTLSRNTGGYEIAGHSQSGETEKKGTDTIQKTISKLAINLRTKNEKGCQFINAYNDFFSLQHNG